MSKLKTTVVIRKIGPVEARLLMENRLAGQRKLRPSHVQRLVEDMRLGRFILSPDAITIINGMLGNGQHRMAAADESGLEQEFLVLETNDPAIYKIMDGGIKRTVGDVLGSEYASQIAAIARLVCGYDKKLLSVYGGNLNRLGRLDIVGFAESHGPELLEVVQFVKPLQKQTPIVPLSVIGAAAVLGCRRNSERTRSFVSAVFNGLEPESAAWLFRERMIKNASTKSSKLSREYAFALALKSLKSYCNGNNMGVLKVSQGEPFPEL